MAGTSNGEGSYSNVTASITGSNGAWTTATSSSGAASSSTASGGSKLYLMASTNVNTTSTRTVSLTATVTDSAGTGTKTATVSWTQNADEKVEKAGSDGKIERKYSYNAINSSMTNMSSAGGDTRTLHINPRVTKYYY